MDLKPGWKTTEFWMAVVVSVVGMLIESGAIAPGLALDGLGMLASALAAAGYSWSRAMVKKELPKKE